jgi:hypothetical protein
MVPPDAPDPARGSGRQFPADRGPRSCVSADRPRESPPGLGSRAARRLPHRLAGAPAHPPASTPSDLLPRSPPHVQPRPHCSWIHRSSPSAPLPSSLEASGLCGIPGGLRQAPISGIQSSWEGARGFRSTSLRRVSVQTEAREIFRAGWVSAPCCLQRRRALLERRLARYRVVDRALSRAERTHQRKHRPHSGVTETRRSRGEPPRRGRGRWWPPDGRRGHHLLVPMRSLQRTPRMVLQPLSLLQIAPAGPRQANSGPAILAGAFAAGTRRARETRNATARFARPRSAVANPGA